MRVTAKDIAEALGGGEMVEESMAYSPFFVRRWKFSRFSESLGLHVWFSLEQSYMGTLCLVILPFEVCARGDAVYVLAPITSLDRLKALDWEQIELDVFKKVCS